jgi:hypothetical protein
MSDSNDGKFFIFIFGNKTLIGFFHVRVSSTSREGRHKEGFADEGIALFGDGSFAFFLAGVMEDNIEVGIACKLFLIGDKLKATSFSEDGKDGHIAESFRRFDVFETLSQIRLGFD